MKKLFTMIAVCASTLTVSARTPLHAHTSPTSQKGSMSAIGSSVSNLRSISCDTLSNLSNLDTATYFAWQSPSVGYASGNGALDESGTFYPIIGVAEKFDAPAGTGRYVSQALVFFTPPVINLTHADSTLTVTAYVYDTTGSSLAFNQYAPGNVLDSASVTLATIAADSLTGTTFTFTNHATLTSGAFFITVSFPQTTGDTVIVYTNDGNTGHGNGQLALTASGQTLWASYDSIIGGPLSLYIFPSVCGTAAPSCPTITVTATEIANTNSADASASGGVAPYTYSWSGGSPSVTTDSVSGLTNGNTYTVTASDHNSCTGTATVSISTGIASVGNITGFNIFPNPSTGSFTASVHLASASDVFLSITDLTGSKIYESTDANTKDINKNINLGTIAAGIYIASIKTAEGTANQRIVIK
jgi:hypothetical protein